MRRFNGWQWFDTLLWYWLWSMVIASGLLQVYECVGFFLMVPGPRFPR
jgi:hypothetical protein